MLRYIGPDQLFPITSILGGIAGILMIFWRHIKNLSGRLVRRLRRRTP